MLVTISLAPHPQFTLDGKDLRVDVPVTPYEAVLGGKVRGAHVGRRGRTQYSGRDQCRAGVPPERQRLSGWRRGRRCRDHAHRDALEKPDEAVKELMRDWQARARPTIRAGADAAAFARATPNYFSGF